MSVVQQPLTGLADDVAATKRVIDQLQGLVILVGHSYGGTIITVTGADPKVRALVFVAALQPDVADTTNKLAASMPGRVSSSDFKLNEDGFIFIDPTEFAAHVGADLSLGRQNIPIAPMTSGDSVARFANIDLGLITRGSKNFVRLSEPRPARAEPSQPELSDMCPV